MGCAKPEAAENARVRRDLERIYASAVAAVEPGRLVALAFEGLTPGAERVAELLSAASRIFALSVGKAALAMAAEIDRRCGDRLCAAIAVTPKATAPPDKESSAADARSAQNRAVTPTERVEIHYASHPLPDETSMAAATAVLRMLSQAGPNDLAVVAVSGGASAMLTSPAGAIALEDKIAITSALMRAGASIHELNTVRKHLSAIKGGQLLRAVNGARVLGLILSDVPGDNLATIGSGISAPDPTTFSEAIGVLKRRRLWGRAPESVRDHLERGAAGEFGETVKSGDRVLGRLTNVLVGDNPTALAAAENAARTMGYTVERWRELRGEANDLARGLAAHLCAIEREKICVLAGGEPVVTVRGGGRGGRAQQCALALALELDGIGATRRARTIAALVAGTDGIDGPTDAAGAFAYVDTVRRARDTGVDPLAALKHNDSYGVFSAIGDLFITGPTGTNVSDIFIGLANY